MMGCNPALVEGRAICAFGGHKDVSIKGKVDECKDSEEHQTEEINQDERLPWKKNDILKPSLTYKQENNHKEHKTWEKKYFLFSANNSVTVKRRFHLDEICLG